MSVKQPDADVKRKHQHADRHLPEDLPGHQLDRRHRREQHFDDAIRLLLHGLRQQRLAADHAHRRRADPANTNGSAAIERQVGSALDTDRHRDRRRAANPRHGLNLGAIQVVCANARRDQRFPDRVVQLSLDAVVDVLAERTAHTNRTLCALPRPRRHRAGRR